MTALDDFISKLRSFILVSDSEVSSMMVFLHCTCSSVHTHPMEGHQKFLGGGGGVLKAKILEAKYEATCKLEFPGGRGGAKQKTFHEGSKDIFWSCTIVYTCSIVSEKFEGKESVKKF